jgi:hypothetical protein
MQTLTTIPHDAATRLRVMLSELQLEVIESSDIGADAISRLVQKISNEGFRMVDELEGVVR